MAPFVSAIEKGLIMRKLMLVLLIAIGFCSVSLPADCQELTVFAMCPPRTMSWANPRALLFSTAGNKLTFHHMQYKHSIGHVFIELKNGDERMMAGSIPVGDSNALNKQMLMKEGVGLGILFANMPGTLETAADLDPQLPDRYTSGRIAFITFRLSQSTYDRLVKFIKEYKERGYDKIYNGLNEPRRGLGAGCGTFGMACLDVAGLLHPVWRNVWYRHVDIAQRLIGGRFGGGKKVSVAQILMAGCWARDGEPTRRLDLCDPDLVYKWVNATYDRQLENGDRRIGLVKRKNAKGLVYDCSHVPTPTEPIFIDD